MRCHPGGMADHNAFPFNCLPEYQLDRAKKLLPQLRRTIWAAGFSNFTPSPRVEFLHLPLEFLPTF